MKNLVNFHPTTQKPENFFSMGSFCPKFTRFEVYRNKEELSFMTLNSDERFERTLVLWFRKLHEELGQLSSGHSKVEKLYFDNFFLSQAYNASGRNMRYDTEG